jgi:cell division protein FtsQ
VAAIAGVGAIAYFAWFRDSSLVAVQNVNVKGVQSSDRGKIVGALTHAAKQMTTLHVETGRLESAVSDLPTVASVSADASFPHGLTIHVTEREPVLTATDGDQSVPVAADGSVLPGIKAPDGIPALQVDSLPGSGRLSGTALAEALMIGAAPSELRPLIDQTAVTRDYGVVVTMRGGIQLRFGTGGNRAGKWAAAAAVLADPALTSLTYVDVRAPQRPAVGGTSDPSPATTPVTAAPTPVTGTP